VDGTIEIENLPDVLYVGRPSYGNQNSKVELFKLSEDGKTVLKGHYGRYHRAVATGEYANKIGPSITPIYVGPYDIPSGTFGDLTLSRSNENLAFDPDYKAPYTDQYIASLEREIAKGFGSQLNYIYKRGRKFAGWTDITGQYVRVPYVDDNDYPLDNPTGRTIELYQLVSDPALRQFRITNPPGFDSDIHAVSLALFKHMSEKWQMTASTTWMRATGALQEGQGGAGEAGSGVGIIQRGGLQFRQFGFQILIGHDQRLDRAAQIAVAHRDRLVASLFVVVIVERGRRSGGL